MRLNFIFALFFLFVSQHAFSQVYVNFISTSDSSDQWNDHVECWSNNGSCFDERTKVYKIEGDTLINSVSYAKLYMKEHYIAGTIIGSSCPEENVFSAFAYYGAIREDQKQVFLIKEQDPEYLVYDFNLVTGDTVPDPSNNSSNVQDRIISNIGQVQIDGINRKSYELQSGAIIIEGIGSSNGLFNPITQGISCTYSLNCYSEYGNTIHGDMNCNWSLDLKSNVILNSYILFPNPASDNIWISGIEEGDEIRILDSSMKTIKTMSTEGHEMQIDISTWARGVYFFQVINKDEVESFKFIKQ